MFSCPLSYEVPQIGKERPSNMYSTMEVRKVRVGTRGSPLALVQANMACEKLKVRHVGPHCRLTRLAITGL